MGRPKVREDGFPTRSDMRFWTVAEKTIFEASQEVEKLGADTKLTEAVNLLGKARDLVADFVEQPSQDSVVFHLNPDSLTLSVSINGEMATYEKLDAICQSLNTQQDSQRWKCGEALLQFLQFRI